ncbi:hypothetical protein B0T11DRAFT_355575 [Plectosphaerella cucumerina]|uniref:Uncharacterized protein n=1 Tax=Plectosphaerella cucumerina TaxID=40658 RepID=A0A8K0X1R7_9PEZI|nr:hypothetical protein B0T11DRAFT_355575 [Plectosphaerella cucumerina]
MPNYHPQTLDDPFVDMPAMPREDGRGPPSKDPYGTTAPLLQLQPPSPDLTHPPQLALLPPPVIRASPDADAPQRSESPVIPRWSPDSPSAAHPNLPPPPSYESPLARTRTRSNEDSTAGSFSSPFADTNSLHSLSSDGIASPPRHRPDERPKLGGFGHKARGFVVLNGSNPSFVEANVGLGSKGYASEDMASRRRRNQKIKWGGLSISLCVALVLLIALAIGVGVGVVKAT